MALNTKTLSFHNLDITFVQGTGGRWIVPAKLLGKALGYSDDGQKLVDLMFHRWGMGNNKEVLQFEGEVLASLKKDTPSLGVPPTANSAVFLTVEGVVAILLRSRTTLAIEFRAFLAGVGEGLVPDELLKKLTPRERKKPAEVKKEDLVQVHFPLTPPVVLPPALPQEVAVPLFILKEMQTSGLFSREQLAGLFMDLYTRTLPGMVMVPQAQSQAVVQAQPGYLYLTHNHKHPSYPGYLTSEEIGREFGWDGDKVKKFTTAYARSKGRELPNNVAKRLADENGIKSLVDASGLPTYFDAELDCVAVYSDGYGDVRLWRNYWGPGVVMMVKSHIRATIEEEQQNKKN
jgi:hypothetical protein